MKIINTIASRKVFLIKLFSVLLSLMFFISNCPAQAIPNRSLFSNDTLAAQGLSFKNSHAVFELRLIFSMAFKGLNSTEGDKNWKYRFPLHINGMLAETLHEFGDEQLLEVTRIPIRENTGHTIIHIKIAGTSTTYKITFKATALEETLNENNVSWEKSEIYPELIDLWEDSRIVSLSKEKKFTRSDMFIKEDSIAARSATLPVYQYLPFPTIRIIEKYLKNIAYTVFERLIETKPPGCCPIFDKGGKYELHLAPLGYIPLSSVSDDYGSGLSSEIRDFVRYAINDSLRSNGDIFSHGHLHANNIMVKLDGTGKVIDVKIIDWKYAHESRLSPDLLDFFEGRRNNLIGANLDGPRPNDYDIEMGRADPVLATSTEGLNFEEVDMHDANMRNLSLHWCNFRKADLSGAKMSNSSYLGSDFTGAKMRNIELNIPPGDYYFEYRELFKGVKFSNVDFTDSKFTNLILTDIDLNGAIFNNTILDNVAFKNAKLKNTNFIKSSITNIDAFTLAELDNTKFDLKHSQHFKDLNFEVIDEKDHCLVTNKRRKEHLSFSYTNKEHIISKEITDTSKKNNFLRSFSRALEETPLEIKINVNLLPEDPELKRTTLKTWAYMILTQDLMNFKSNYIFERTINGKTFIANDITPILLDVIKEISQETQIKIPDNLANIINNYHSDSKKLIISLMHVNELNNINKTNPDHFTENTFPIALSETLNIQQTPLWDYESALYLGLFQAALYKLSKDSKENTTEDKQYILKRASVIYEKLFPDKFLTEEIISEIALNPTKRLIYAISLALPPAGYLNITSINEYNTRLAKLATYA
ncbi:MAG: pentapeptide repeat-containing protein [Candidatus Omnitrophica bacterium]|nr:pentapeptide repeat-containing protein [Candidatus Omnitrophota bacterium]